jgi:predicted ATP-grasp superfamily ATP-dependent carboligase
MRADRLLRVLVVGQNVRHIASSAARAGFVVFAADCYSDLDLAESVSQSFLLECDPSIPGDLAKSAEDLIRRVLDRYPIDCLVLGPGVEEMRIKGVRVMNNPPEKISLVSDKLWLARWLEREGFAAVPTWPLGEDLDCMEFPLMVKPRKGAGGAENRLVTNDEDLARLEGDLIVQEMVEGIPSSVSVIADGERAVAISANEQLIGTDWLGGSGFRYCGNISPLERSRDDPVVADMIEIAEEIATRLRLVGSNGIDFLLTESGPVVLEVNPRFQGSLDAVEISTGMNLFQAHLLSFDGNLPERPKARGFWGRGVLFAKADLKIGADLRGVSPWIADVPRPESFAKKGDPVASVISFGESRKKAMDLLKSRSSAIYRACRRL